MADPRELDEASRTAMHLHVARQVDTARRIATTKLHMAKLSLIFSLAIAMVATNVVISAVIAGGHPNFFGYVFIVVSVVALVISWRGYRAARQIARRVSKPAA
jgi:hypothetical protein